MKTVAIRRGGDQLADGSCQRAHGVDLLVILHRAKSRSHAGGVCGRRPSARQHRASSFTWRARPASRVMLTAPNSMQRVDRLQRQHAAGEEAAEMIMGKEAHADRVPSG